MAIPDPKAPCTKCSKVHPKCKAHNRQGGPCGLHSLPGQAVCDRHGAKSPQALASAKRRLLEAVDPVAADLIRYARGEIKSTRMTKDGEAVEISTDDAVRLRAIFGVLDRAGIPAASRSEVSGRLEHEFSVPAESRARLDALFPMGEPVVPGKEKTTMGAKGRKRGTKQS